MIGVRPAHGREAAARAPGPAGPARPRISPESPAFRRNGLIRRGAPAYRRGRPPPPRRGPPPPAPRRLPRRPPGGEPAARRPRPLRRQPAGGGQGADRPDRDRQGGHAEVVALPDLGQGL